MRCFTLRKVFLSILNGANMLKIRLKCCSKRSYYMAFLNFFFGSKKSSCCTKNPIIDPIFSLDYYFSVLEETKSPLNGFRSTQIKKLWVKSFLSTDQVKPPCPDQTNILFLRDDKLLYFGAIGADIVTRIICNDK